MSRVLYIWTDRTPHRASSFWETQGARSLATWIAEHPDQAVPVQGGFVIARAVSSVVYGVDSAGDGAV